ncbi:MAG: disulfide bond formation protein B [Candidatus Reconcilbacillus cellulovorans]|uniref:Disulfide bond formation protein B n=1 Tax=Candidatus Reconcilbacillus cellulovorans TaxID=1906605 RepID=A0A2A6DWV6_9BACL|nr:MAG: disulfide bond formation protein B [Candidatus Reconcilbacillus cellulovorans]
MNRKPWWTDHALHWAFVVALVATLGSLYFSEVMRFTPCSLCWFQRILMYPLVVILGIAAARNDRGVVVYALPLASIGAMFSLYHVLLQKMPWLKKAAPSCGQVPCETDYLNWFGFVTIPMLALTAFILIIIILAMLARAERRR